MDPRELDEPIGYDGGRVVFSATFRTDPAFLSVLPLMEQQKARAQDLGLYLYLMFNPRSVYKNYAEEERFGQLLSDNRFTEPDWLIGTLKNEHVMALSDRYVRMVTTPGQRMYQGLVESVERMLQELKTFDVNGEGDPLKLIERGKKLYAAQQEILAMMDQEKKMKVRGGYKPRLFEVPDAIKNPIRK